MGRARQPVSLTARAVRWLSQREHSEAELRRKLMHVEREAPLEAAEGADLSARVDAVIVWLREHDFLSDARFVESRVHARAPGHGLRRIRHELEQHGVALSADAAAALRSTELERADAMRRRRFGDNGHASALDQARCARWLIQRGFSADTVARVVRPMRRSPSMSRDEAAVEPERQTADDV